MAVFQIFINFNFIISDDAGLLRIFVYKIATIDELDEVVDLKMSIAYHIFGSY